MLNPEQIIEHIREDAPCVYDILHEESYPIVWQYPHSDSSYTWDDYFEQNPEVSRLTALQLLNSLKEYSGDNHDTHVWSGRYAQMIETDEAINQMIAVLEENKKKLAPIMDYEYTMKIDLLKNVQEFITT